MLNNTCVQFSTLWTETLIFVLQGGGWVAGASNARLYFEDDHSQKRIGSWCASSRSSQWIKVDLGRVKKITGIATQGDSYIDQNLFICVLDSKLKSWTKLVGTNMK